MIKILVVIVELEFIAVITACLLAVYLYVMKRPELNSKLKIVAGVLTVYFVAVAGIETYLQYATWASDALAKNFLPPVSSVGYFISYSLVHFWLGKIFAIGLGFFFYLFLRLIGKKRDWLFLSGETELGWLCALVAGWPGFAIFVPLVFIVALAITLFRRLALKQERTLLGPAFLVAALLTLIFGNYLINWLGLEVLRV